MGTCGHRFHGVFSIKSSVVHVKTSHIKNCFAWWQAQHNHDNNRNEKIKSEFENLLETSAFLKKTSR